ncbi:hypothetical protein [Spiroplasma endosymbiont of Nebria brevicollis]|uniref:hypothetical protein n=1 Tax=Spiroplasma endosymbiont of Nebria brevicollis TaxID=3066284 RepID=UPI00313C3D56
MYITLLTQLIEPILFEKISEIEIRELSEKQHYELMIMAPKSFLPILIGKKNTTKNALTTIIESKAHLENNTISLVISELYLWNI